ncbi:MAG: UDP-N-acetylglucosamine 4,6-dehydratase (inverting) [Ekhidna sp.]
MNWSLNGKSVLITGGTGSLGHKLVENIFLKYPQINRLVIYSRDEQKQFQMSQIFPHTKYRAIRYFIGDIRDYNRLKTALEGIDTVIHAAAMKHVDIAEYNPMECIKTNIIGAENLIRACLETDVENVVALSTDKAAAPINLYGASKLASDKLFIAANNIKGNRDIKFSVVRYGNVMGSNGSVIPFFLKKKAEGYLPITDARMTRFNISLKDGCEMVLHALEHAWGGELFIPKIPSYSIMEMAKAIAPDIEHRIIGIRPGEKLHEEMITASDSFNTYDLGQYYTILPQIPNWDPSEYTDRFKAKPVEVGFNYNSGTNEEFLNANELRKLIIEHVDQTLVLPE